MHLSPSLPCCCVGERQLFSVPRSLKRTITHIRIIKMSDIATLVPPASNQDPTTPRKVPPKFKHRQTRQFKSKPPKKGVKGFGDDIPGMEGLGTEEKSDTEELSDNLRPQSEISR
ncbi:retinal cone rhodopsin-sensitive cGMP 3',5'-cyclic phosphodiesterase subunit gamma isoform X2 [Talpa occidentalis]|uniref:retinal cone rhodopsin-sensitive cGMP 3',5'-cyclic phosphodiesterase subunit gamma isoform X2 n=1 Tax=Talpa occidentalis TaxID=50954 RepID=UPI00188E0791|nr:retinal cone rhodopsin-sensitive cGMP 3',5'-cyclic phosphodiesterase subunit gamma isoform X2 [Talpa occidentalis]